MKIAIDDDDSEYWFTLRLARNMGVGSQKLAVVEFPRDVALTTSYKRHGIGGDQH